ncbi:MAG: LysE family translocator [Rhodospirillaceae bacterium]
MLSPDYLITALIVVISPGTGVLYTVAMGLAGGFRAGVFAALGCTFGIVPHLIAGILGLSALMHGSAVLFQGVKLLGALYLLWLAWSILRQGGALSESGLTDDRHSGASAWVLMRRGLLINILNPKLSLFFLAFLPQFLSPETATPTHDMMGLALVFMAMTFAVFVVYGALAAGARRHVFERPTVMRVLRYGFASVFAFLGARLALAER